MTLTGWKHHHGQWLWYCCIRQEVGRHPSTQLLHPLCPIATLALQKTKNSEGRQVMKEYLSIFLSLDTEISFKQWQVSGEVSVLRAYLMIFFREFPTKLMAKSWGFGVVLKCPLGGCNTIKHSTLVRKFSHSTLKNLILKFLALLDHFLLFLEDFLILKSPLFLLSDSRGFSCCRDGEDRFGRLEDPWGQCHHLQWNWELGIIWRLSE